MPTYDASTPIKTYKFLGQSIAVPQPYVEGGILTAPLASFLNSALAGRVGNAYAGAFRRKLEQMDEANQKLFDAKDSAAVIDTDAKGKTIPHKHTIADLGDVDWQSEFNTLFAAYEPGAGRAAGGGASGADPVSTLTTTLAKIEFNKRIKAKGKTPKELHAHKREDGTSQYAFLLDQFIAANPGFEASARMQLEQSAATPVTDIDFGE